MSGFEQREKRFGVDEVRGPAEPQQIAIARILAPREVCLPLHLKQFHVDIERRPPLVGQGDGGAPMIGARVRAQPQTIGRGTASACGRRPQESRLFATLAGRKRGPRELRGE